MRCFSTLESLQRSPQGTMTLRDKVPLEYHDEENSTEHGNVKLLPPDFTACCRF